MAQDPTRIPVIVGVGQVNDRTGRGEVGADSLQLMIQAIEAADKDGGGGWLDRADRISVVRQISWPKLGYIPEKLIAHFGIAPAHHEETPLPTGESPIEFLNEAANRIATGDSTVTIVAGAEALRSAAAAAAQAGNANANASADMSARGPLTLRKRYGLTAPIDVYPLYENACRASWGQTLEEGQAETGAIWSRFSQVAAQNDHAWLRDETSAQDIATATPQNRQIAFPYTKLMVANSAVNQGAAFIVASLQAARDAGVPEDRLVYIGPGAAAHETEDPTDREQFDASPSMAVALEKALALNGVTIDDVEAVELYSCFPCIPKMARRVLQWPAEKPATVFGGLTFGGGPIGNYMTHSVASMVEVLRERGRYGLLFANGGFATHNHALLLRRDPAPEGAFPQDFHYQAEADAARKAAPEVVEEHEGPGTVETYTVLYSRDGAPRQGVVLARTDDGRRFIALVPASDVAGIEALTSGAREPVGRKGRSTRQDDLNIWSFDADD